MVNLLTDYTTQIYHALSTDARPTGETGSQLWEIDTGKRFIFDGTSWNELPDGGGGGGGYTLLQSGTYTLSENNPVNFDIPVPEIAASAIRFVYVELQDDPYSNAAHMFCWGRFYKEYLPEEAADITILITGKAITADGQPRYFAERDGQYTLIYTPNTTTLRVRSGNSSNYPIKTGTYKWYMWG